MSVSFKSVKLDSTVAEEEEEETPSAGLRYPRNDDGKQVLECETLSVVVKAVKSLKPDIYARLTPLPAYQSKERLFCFQRVFDKSPGRSRL